MAVKTQMSAVQILEQKLKVNPQSRAFSRLADMYRAKGDIDPAITLCLEGLAEHPNYVTGRLVLGRCYAEKKNFQAAIEEFKKVCVADKRNHAALKMLADIFSKQGRSEEAGGLYRILFEMEPDNPSIKSLSAKHPSSIQGSAFDILGIKPMNVASSVQNLKSAGIDDSADIQNMDTILQPNTPHTASSAVHDNSSTILTDDLLPTQTDVLDGSDIENQLDSIFGETSAPPIPESQTSDLVIGGADPFTTTMTEPTGSDIANQLDAMFGTDQSSIFTDNTLPENNETGVFSITTDEPTGDDIANQIDSMFANTAPDSSAPAVTADSPAAAANSAEISETNTETTEFTKAISEEPTGDDIIERLDFLFSEPENASNTAAAGEQEMVYFDSGTNEANNTETNEPQPDVSLYSEAANVAIPCVTDDMSSTDGDSTDEDLENKLSELFGGEAFQTSIDSNDPILSNEQYDVDAIIAEELNAAKNDSTPAAAEEPEIAESVSGDDISSRIDELFAQHGEENAAPDFSGLVGGTASDSADTIQTDSTLSDFDYTENIDSEINQLIASAHDSAQITASDLGDNLIEDSADTPSKPQTEDSIQENIQPPVQEAAIENPPNMINGDDVEARLKDLFNEHGAAPPAISEESVLEQQAPADTGIEDSNNKAFEADSSALFADESLQSEDTFTGELIDSGSDELNLIDTSEQDYAIDHDDVQEKIRQLFKSGVDETDSLGIGSRFGEESEIDERDTDVALELPDHVLTPTLADIYFQQGQPKLSLQIYERLALRDPKDPRLQSKIQEIKEFLDSEADDGGETPKKKSPKI